MREAYGSAWIFALVLVFILIFSSYLALTISYQRAFKVKNEVANIIEKQEGLTDNSIKIINNYLRNSGYKQRGTCKTDDDSKLGGTWVGAKTLDTKGIGGFDVPAQDRTQYFYCVMKINSGDPVFGSKSFYRVKLFYKFDLPVIGDIINFEVSGETNDVAIPADSI